MASRLRTAFSGNPQKLESELSSSSETLKRLLEKSSEGGPEKNVVSGSRQEDHDEDLLGDIILRNFCWTRY